MYITKSVNLFNSTVYFVIKSFKNENRTGKETRSGRSAKVTRRDQRFILRRITKNPLLRAIKISRKLSEKFSTSISKKLYDEFSDQLVYMGVQQEEKICEYEE
ncbi:hypothetical protein AVEN_86040-1 [Araneus ventricosus]|uniref:Uncharacterized protein n=1 Tax=Araneus ventricosus TaxID=182803 RepID=A0A4Y2SCZ9_ARAVE|nr:hypothetical protein AVEN_86040-1 [Araneus ventricosus]